MQSVLNFHANRGEQCHELSRKEPNERTIHIGWGTMLSDILQNYLPHYVSFMGSWK